MWAYLFFFGGGAPFNALHSIIKRLVDRRKLESDP